MNKILENCKERFPRLAEVYEVVQTVEVVVKDGSEDGSRRCRIEVLKRYGPSVDNYVARYWDLESVYLQPSYPRKGGKFQRGSEDETVLTESRFMPSAYGSTPEKTLLEALHFLADR